MNVEPEQNKILRVVLTVLVRLLLAVAAVAGIVALGCNMVLSLIFHGPSETARDQLTLTMMASAETRDIPVRFLGQEMVDYICATGYVLPDRASDPGLITPPQDAGQTQILTKDGQGFTATIRLLPSVPELPASGGDHFVGFTPDGVLVLAVSGAEAQTLGISGRCTEILMMDGFINEGLMNSTSGWAPRIAVGQRADGTVILLTTDGGSRENPGATWQDLINLMAEQGAVNACCLSVNEE